jgi:CRP-like cAMP-binding protein
VEISEYIMHLKAFQAWALKEMNLLARSVRTIVHYRGEVIFEQGSSVKGLYILWHGSASMEHIEDVQGICASISCET